MKRCSKCKKIQPLNAFYKNKTKKDGLGTECKSCLKVYHKEYRKHYCKTAQYKAYKKQYRKTESQQAYNRAYNKKQWLSRKDSQQHKTYMHDYMSSYRQTDQYQQGQRKWRLSHKPLLRQYAKEYRKKQKNNPRWYLDKSMSTAIMISLKGQKKGRNWESLVGYTCDDLYTHLEQQFDSHMTWDNYGSYWHIDHIIPKSHFNYTNTDDPGFRICWSLANLQPLEAIENIRKGNKLFYQYEKTR
jgi:hypothetical protein